jgi:hypothetical protein
MIVKPDTTLPPRAHDRRCLDGGVHKRVYRTEKDATKAMVGVRRRDPSPLWNVYPCPAGQGWHIGHLKAKL